MVVTTLNGDGLHTVMDAFADLDSESADGPGVKI